MKTRVLRWISQLSPALAACLGLCSAVFCGPAADAQPIFSASQLPSIIGSFSRAYINTNTDPSTLIGPTGGPQQWIFSQPPDPVDTVRRLDIVSPTNGGNQSSFPNASFCELYTDEVAGTQEQEYYQIAPKLGRFFYGYDDSLGLIVFPQPAIDIPSLIGYGSNWSYAVTQNVGYLSFVDTVSAQVDAYGTLVLPMGTFTNVLRVNQLTSQQEFVDSLPAGPATYVREYMFLIADVGVAAHIISLSSSSPPPANFTSVFEFRRVFESSTLANPPAKSVSGLTLQLQKGLAVLNWASTTNVSTFQVQAVTNLTMTN